MSRVKSVYQLRLLRRHLVGEALSSRSSEQRNQIKQSGVAHVRRRQLTLELMTEQHQVMCNVHTVVVMDC